MNHRPKLVDLYRACVANLPTKDAKTTKALWHSAAKRFLSFHMLTSDPVPPLPKPDKKGRVPDHTRPIAAVFLSRDPSELVELYRVTKPRRYV